VNLNLFVSFCYNCQSQDYCLGLFGQKNFATVHVCSNPITPTYPPPLSTLTRHYSLFKHSNIFRHSSLFRSCSLFRRSSLFRHSFLFKCSSLFKHPRLFKTLQSVQWAGYYFSEKVVVKSSSQLFWM